MATMADLDELALALPGDGPGGVRKDGRPAYTVHGKASRSTQPAPRCRRSGDRRAPRRRADVPRRRPRRGSRSGCSDDRGIYFTTPHFDNYPAVLVRIPDLTRLDREELYDLVVEAWLTRVQKARREGLAAEHESDDG
jgi:hypothetical protein